MPSPPDRLTHEAALDSRRSSADSSADSAGLDTETEAGLRQAEKAGDTRHSSETSEPSLGLDPCLLWPGQDGVVQPELTSAIWGPALSRSELTACRSDPILSRSRSELAGGLEAIAEAGTSPPSPPSPSSAGRRHGDTEAVRLDALSYRLSLYLADREERAPAPRPARRSSLRCARSRRRLSRRSSEHLSWPTEPAPPRRRHSEVPPGGRRQSRRASSRRSSSRLGSRAGSERRLRSVDGGPATGGAGGLLPAGDLEPKERRRRQVVLAVMAGAFIIVSMSVGLVFVMLYLASSENAADQAYVRKENEEMYQGLKNMFNSSSTPASATPGDG